MIRLSILAWLLALLAAPALAFADDPVRSAGPRVFELRTYLASAGKLDALHARFRDHTNGLFKKHGMEIVGFWVPQDEKDGKANTLIYMLAYPSREAAKSSWDAFRSDPDWHKARDESERDGKLVDKVTSVFLDPTGYSPTK